MNEQVTLYNMFPDYEPPEGLDAALSQAAIVAADIHMEERAVHVALHRDLYIPQRLLNQAGKEIARLYGLRRVELTATHPEDQLHCVEPEELMELFVSRNSMTRGSLAGAKWTWNGPALTIHLVANGKKELEELIPQVQSVLRERFAAPVTITVAAGETLEGKALFDVQECVKSGRVYTCSLCCQAAGSAVFRGPCGTPRPAQGPRKGPSDMREPACAKPRPRPLCPFTSSPCERRESGPCRPAHGSRCGRRRTCGGRRAAFRKSCSGYTPCSKTSAVCSA